MSASTRATSLLFGLALYSVLPGAVAFRTVVNANATEAIDWGATIDTIREIDRTKTSDAFVVFASSSDTELNEIARPPLGKVSLETFKDALRSCGPNKKVCIGFYKINYPVFKGSTTLKEKALLVMAFADGMSIMTKMPVSRFVWPPLKEHLRTAHIAPSATQELTGDRKVNALNVDSLWKTLAGRASRVDHDEIASFKEHGEEQIQNALLDGSAVVTPVVEVDENDETDENDQSEPVDTGSDGAPSLPSSGGQPAMTVDITVIEALVEKKMQALEAKVEKIVEAKAKEMAQRAAQDEVGRAIRKLGDKVEDAYTSVGKMWIDKAKR